MTLLLFVLLGLTAGAFSGVVGLGGGIIIVPALVFLFGMSQKTAQGTTLALLVPPIGLAAAYAYYKEGFVDLRAAALICVGFVGGSWIGARFATGLPEVMLKRIFGTVVILVGIKMVLSAK